MVLVQKWPFLQLFFRRYRPEKCVLRYSRTKKRFSTPLEQEHKPSQDSYWPVKWFYDIVGGKNAFLGYKNKKFKKSKNWDFFKEFGQKMAIFPLFFSQYWPGKCVLKTRRQAKPRLLQDSRSNSSQDSCKDSYQDSHCKSCQEFWQDSPGKSCQDCYQDCRSTSF